MRSLLQAVFLLVGLSLAITPEIGATVQDPVRVEQGQLYGAATKWSVAQLRRHSAADASRLAALLVGQILPVSSLLAPCEAGASAPSVRRRNYATDH